MKKYILDASVILTYYIGKNKKLKKEFNQILKSVDGKKAELYSINLLALEIANGLRFTLKNETKAQNALTKSLSLPIKYFSLKNIHHEKILELSYELNTSVYDTSYHFTAKLINGTFLTCDKKYYQKAQKLEAIKLLG